ncbi:hypothetical protein H696_00305 [Fonticula alba]|uniref:Helicase ATP-binding domain-containing protein n=1 Tax=Fonticula alba TaxID=691883 RepID=A0A058ZGW2_FONAL|nr:hypothetical protein H696_00305 [Fonticula alba]KCV72727.1 hypothetical protein H696_00305 [Fonticula alba]|eukprot:XP_009492428.1 hypothetical protein H696_00305 [Fonticula alba]
MLRAALFAARSTQGRPGNLLRPTAQHVIRHSSSLRRDQAPSPTMVPLVGLHAPTAPGTPGHRSHHLPSSDGLLWTDLRKTHTPSAASGSAPCSGGGSGPDTGITGPLVDDLLSVSGTPLSDDGLDLYYQGPPTPHYSQISGGGVGGGGDAATQSFGLLSNLAERNLSTANFSPSNDSLNAGTTSEPEFDVAFDAEFNQANRSMPTFAPSWKATLLSTTATTAHPTHPSPPRVADWAHIDHALSSHFQLSSLRPMQRQAIEAHIQGKDSLVLLPTGSGKSICYQLPGIISPHLCLVIMPLLSLAEDQMASLRQLALFSASAEVRASVVDPGGPDAPNGPDAVHFLNSSTSTETRRRIFSQLSRGNIRFLLTTPETLQHNRALRDTILALYHRNKLGSIIVDEAHCVSQWGHDFRPAYAMIGQFRRQVPKVPLMALTASATPIVQSEAGRIQVPGAGAHGPRARHPGPAVRASARAHGSSPWCVAP